MVAMLALGQYGDLEAACADWVAPYLGGLITPDPALVARYEALFPVYRHGYQQMAGRWRPPGSGAAISTAPMSPAAS